MTFDPTPPAREAVGPSEGLWADAYALVDAMRTRWMTSVVGYDLRVQVGTLRKLWTWWAAQRAATEAREQSSSNDGDWMPSALSVRWLIGLVLLTLLAGLLVRILRGRRKAAHGSIPEHEREAVRLLHDLDRTLARKGVARGSAVTPLEHARSLGELGFASSEDVERITRGYVESRYGGRPLSVAEIAQLRAALTRVRQTSRSART